MALLDIVGKVQDTPLHWRVALVTALPILILLTIYFIIVPNAIKVCTHAL